MSVTATPGASAPSQDYVDPRALMIDTHALPWSEVPGMPGAWSKLLSVDANADRVTSLFKVAAGVQLPIHRHVAAAEMYCLQGCFTYEAGSISEGGYGWEPGGTVHAPEASEDDTILLVISYGSVLGLDEDGNPNGVLDIPAQVEAARANGAIDHLVKAGMIDG